MILIQSTVRVSIGTILLGYSKHSQTKGFGVGTGASREALVQGESTLAELPGRLPSRSRYLTLF